MCGSAPRGWLVKNMGAEQHFGRRVPQSDGSLEALGLEVLGRQGDAAGKRGDEQRREAEDPGANKAKSGKRKQVRCLPSLQGGWGRHRVGGSRWHVLCRRWWW